MVRQYKSIETTYGKHRPCLRCFNCKTRVFRSLNEMVLWCAKKEIVCSFAWKKRLNKDRILRVYWCTKSYGKPRIFREADKPFMYNCKLFDGTEIHGE